MHSMKKFTHSIFKNLLFVPVLLWLVGTSSAYGQTTVFYEGFDNPTGAPGYLPSTWTTSNYYENTSGTFGSGYDQGMWGRDWNYNCYQTYNGVSYQGDYPLGSPPYQFAYSYSSVTYGTPYGHNSSSCSSGYMWYGCYYNNIGSFGEAATPAINFNSTYSATHTGGFLVSFWVWEYNYSSSYNAKLDVYVNTSNSSTGGTQLGGDIVPYTALGTVGQWVNYTYTIPAAYNTANSVYIIFRASMATSTYTFDILVDDVSVTYVPPCTGTPNFAPVITSSPLATAVCAGAPVLITATDANLNPGIAYNWQSSPTATGPWTNMTSGVGLGTLNYTVPGVTDTTYFRVVDSCTLSHATVASTNVYKIPAIKYYLPYLENFNSTASGSAPPCYTYNDNYGTNWAVVSGIHAADHTVMTAMRASDPASNAAHGKNDFFTVPGFTLTGSQVYAVRFKYARGRQDAIADTGNLYPEHLQVYASTPSPGYTVSNVTGGTLLFDQTITFNNVADTTIYFAPPTNGSYYFSWYSNTAHPASGTSTPIAGGHVIVDSIYITPSTCVAPALTTQPTIVNACIGSPTALTVTASGTANSFQWYKNGVAITGAKAASYSRTAAAYTDTSSFYTVTVTNPCGTVTSSNITLNVIPLPSATVNPSGPTTFCAGSPFSLNGAIGGGYSYVWRTGGVANGGTASSYSPTASGVYSVIVTGPTGCTATSGNTTVTVNPVPTAVITPSGPTSFCNGDSVTLIATTGAGLTYQWYQNNSAIPSGLGGTAVTYEATGAFASGTYKVAVSNANCTITSANTIVQAVAPPTALITGGGGSSICSGSSLTLTASSGTGYRYQWLYNGNNISDTTSTYAATNAGNYAVIVTSGSCSATSPSVPVSVIPSPPAFVTSSASTICAGGYIVLNADTAATATTYTYQWFKGGISTGVTSYTDTITVAGNYTVTVGNSSNCYTTSPVTPVSITPIPPAVVTTTGTGTACTGSTVTLTASAGPGYHYQWLGNTAGVITGATGQYYNATATDVYKVIVTDLFGCNDTSTTGATVTFNAVPAINITSNNTSFCPGGSAVLSASPGGGSGLTYIWYNNGVNTGITAATYTATTTGVITLQATNGNLCSAISSPVATTLNTPPAATVQANGSINFCPGGSVVLSTTSSPLYSYLWRDKAGTVLSLGSTYTATVTDSIDVKVTDNSTTCSATSAFLGVTLNPSPGASAAAIGATTICSGNSVTIAADTNSSAGITYQWKLNTNVLGGATAPTYTASTGGSYTVVTSNGSCTTTSPPIVVTVNPTPSATITPLSNPVICSNEFVTLSATTTTGSTYSWKRNGNPISATGATSPNFTTDTAGSYTLVVTSSLGCSGTSVPTVVTVYATPSVSIQPVTATTVCEGDTAKLYANVTGSGIAYTWLNGTVAIPSAINRSFATTNAGNYTVIATNTNNCSDTSTAITIAVNPAPKPFIAQNNTVLSVSGGPFATYQWYLENVAISGAKSSSYTITKLGKYSVFVSDNSSCAAMSPALNVTSFTASGVANVSANADIKLYPNPTTSIVHIDASMPVNAKISSLDGKLLIQAHHATSVDLSQLANGIYMISLYDDNDLLIKVDRLVKSGW